jgi:hypothetical protein
MLSFFKTKSQVRNAEEHAESIIRFAEKKAEEIIQNANKLASIIVQENNTDTVNCDNSDRHECAICWKRPRQAIILPCRHKHICDICAILPEVQDKCLTCRGEIVYILKSNEKIYG